MVFEESLPGSRCEIDASKTDVVRVPSQVPLRICGPRMTKSRGTTYLYREGGARRRRVR